MVTFRQCSSVWWWMLVVWLDCGRVVLSSARSFHVSDADASFSVFLMAKAHCHIVIFHALGASVHLSFLTFCTGISAHFANNKCHFLIFMKISAGFFFCHCIAIQIHFLTIWAWSAWFQLNSVYLFSPSQAMSESRIFEQEYHLSRYCVGHLWKWNTQWLALWWHHII